MHPCPLYHHGHFPVLRPSKLISHFISFQILKQYKFDQIHVDTYVGMCEKEWYHHPSEKCVNTEREAQPFFFF